MPKSKVYAYLVVILSLHMLSLQCHKDRDLVGTAAPRPFSNPSLPTKVKANSNSDPAPIYSNHFQQKRVQVDRESTRWESIYQNPQPPP